MKYVLLILFFNVYNTSLGQERSGYFDYEKVMKSMPQYVDNKSILEKIDLVYRDTLKSIFKRYEDISIHSDVKWTETQRQKRQETILKLEQEIEDLRIRAINAIKAKEMELSITLDGILLSAISQFAKESGREFLTPKSDMLFCPRCTDYTDELVEFLTSRY